MEKMMNLCFQLTVSAKSAIIVLSVRPSVFKETSKLGQCPNPYTVDSSSRLPSRPLYLTRTAMAADSRKTKCLAVNIHRPMFVCQTN